MEYFKIVIIHSNGNIEYIGENVDELHLASLLEYAKKHYNNKIFEQLNYRHKPGVIGYFFLRFYGDIIFLNTTRNIKKYGYTGTLLLPDEINDIQKESLLQFLDTIPNFYMILATNLRLEDGIVEDDEGFPVSDATPRNVVEQYFKSRSV